MQQTSSFTSLAVIAATAIACGRSLGGAPCPCVEGYTCCAEAQACYPAGQCPGAENSGGDGNSGVGGSGSGGKAVGGKAPRGGAAGAGSTGSGSGSSGGGAAGQTAAAVRFPEFCSSDGWCGAVVNYSALWGNAPDDVWLAASGIADNGAQSAFLHFDGQSFTNFDLSLTSVVNSDVSGIWGAASNDVWAVGSLGGVYHWDGTSWSASIVQASATGGFPFVPNYRAVWGAAPNDVWAVGSSGAIVHFDGATWSGTAPGVDELRGVWGSAADDVWAVGTRGSIIHFDGVEWTPYADAFGGTATSADLEAVWGAASDDVWAVGASATVLHWDGSHWEDFGAVVPVEGDLKGIWGSGSDNVWVTAADGSLVHRDGGGWYKAPIVASHPLRAVWGDAAGRIWAAGDLGSIVHWGDDRVWRSAPVPSVMGDFGALWPTPEGEMWAFATSGWNGRWTGDGWSATTGPNVTAERSRVHGTSATDVWVASGSLRHLEGSEWIYRGQSSNGWRSVWANAIDDVWAVGESTEGQNSSIFHWDGVAELEIDSGLTIPLTSVWGSAANDVWITTSQGTVLRFDGSWRELSVGAVGEDASRTSWYFVTGSSREDVWLLGGYSWSAYKAGGFNFTGRHWNGSEFSEAFELHTNGLTGAWSDANGSWLVGSSIVSWTGSEWKPEHSGTATRPLSAIAGTASELFAVGGGGLILHKRR